MKLKTKQNDTLQKLLREKAAELSAGVKTKRERIIWIWDEYYKGKKDADPKKDADLRKAEKEKKLKEFDARSNTFLSKLQSYDMLACYLEAAKIDATKILSDSQKIVLKRLVDEKLSAASAKHKTLAKCVDHGLNPIKFFLGRIIAPSVMPKKYNKIKKYTKLLRAVEKIKTR